jgi:hypothetical protein
MQPPGRWHTARIGRAAANTGPRVGPLSSGNEPPQYYCALMGHPFAGVYKKDTYVFVSPRPVETAILHNQRRVPTKDTRHVAPYWRLLVVNGPFASFAQALECAYAWVERTRGCKSKKRRGIQLARQYAVRCYAGDTRPPGGSTLRYLTAHAPRRYVRAFRHLAQRSAASTAATPLAAHAASQSLLGTVTFPRK